MPTRDTKSPLQFTPCHLPRPPEGTRRRSLLPCACTKCSPASSEGWRSDDWRLPSDGKPTQRKELAVERRCRAAAISRLHGGTRTEWEPPTLRAALYGLHSPDAATPRRPPASATSPASEMMFALFAGKLMTLRQIHGCGHI